MGLSDEERLNLIVEGINDVVEASRGIGDLHGSKPLKEACAKLWGAYLSCVPYWETTGSGILRHGMPLTAGILKRIESERFPEPHLTPGEFSMENLITDPSFASVYRVYFAVEQILNGIRRYDDKLRMSLRRLEDAVSDIRGACYPYFSHEVYAKAFVGSRLLQKLYSDKKFASAMDAACYDGFRFAVRSGVTGSGSSLKEVLAWDAWRIRHMRTMQHRVILMMRIAGHRIREYDAERIIVATEGIGVRPSEVRREFKKCSKRGEVEAADHKKQYLDEAKLADGDIDYQIHGFQEEDHG